MEHIYITALMVGASMGLCGIVGFLMGLWVSPARDRSPKKRGTTIEIKAGGAEKNPRGKANTKIVLDFFSTSIGASAPAEHMQKKFESTCEHIYEEKKPILKVKSLIGHSINLQRGTPGSAGLDLVATSREYSPSEGRYIYGTGIACEIPAGFCGLIFPRSSVSARLLRPSHAVGVIDSDYRGELRVCYDERNGCAGLAPYEVGERVAQLVLVPCGCFQPVQVEELSETARGAGGFGSTGV